MHCDSETFPDAYKATRLTGCIHRYVRFVDALFEHNMAYPLLCMTSLGHETMIGTLHYMSVVFSGEIPKKEYGKLRMVD